MLDVRSAMRRSAGFHRERVAVRSGERELTYGQAWTRGLQLSHALASVGARPGDRVAVLEDNCIEAADFFLGSAIGNFVRVPLYRRNARSSHVHMLRHTDVKIVVVSEEYASELAGLDAEIEGLKIILRGADYEAWLASFPAVDPDPPVSLDEAFIIRHSAGTSGSSKGIAYTHRAWMNATRDWCFMMPPMDMGDSCLHVGPISHGSGYLFLPTWLAGGRNVLLTKFDGETFVSTLREERIGYFFAVPTMIADVVRRVEGRQQALPDLKAVVISGAPIQPRTALEGNRVFGGTLHQMYGQTEAVPVTFMGPRDWFRPLEGSEPLLSAGRVMPFAELEIRDENNRALPPNAEGEIAIRCDGQMSGLWKDPEQTARRLRDGWVMTGDIGKLDENGFLYVVDRVDDMIVSGGFNIWPAELEQAIAALPEVIEVVVFGIPHEKWGEVPLAEVYLSPGASLVEATIIEACISKLGSYKKPSRVVFRSEPIPRSPVGKIQRKVLREPYWREQARRVSGA